MNTAVESPIPRASVNVTSTANPGERRRAASRSSEILTHSLDEAGALRFMKPLLRRGQDAECTMRERAGITLGESFAGKLILLEHEVGAISSAKSASDLRRHQATLLPQQTRVRESARQPSPASATHSLRA